MDTAMRFLVKDFLTPGLETLLWYTSVIETLFGEKTEGGLTSLLCQRLARALGRTKEERKEIARKFREVYDVRSKLVHGSTEIAGSEIEYQTLINARNLSCQAIIWMMHYLDYVLTTTPCGCQLPSREDLLRVFELDVSARSAGAELLRNLPEGFPSVPSWSDRTDA